MYLNFTKHDRLKVIEIVHRFNQLRESKGLGTFEPFDLQSDILKCHCNGNRLDFKQLLSSPDDDLYSDVIGIRNNINPKTGKLKEGFVPISTSTSY